METDVGALIDAAPCGFLSFIDDGTVTYINTTLLDRLGYQREDVVHQHFEKLLVVGSRIFYQTHFFPLLKLHGHAEEVFILLRAREGEDVGMLCNAVRRERNGSRMTDCVFMEVRERRKFEEALLHARQAADRANVALEARTEEAEEAAERLEAQAVELELQQQQLHELNEDLERQRAAADDANRAKSTFLAVMSHELRTPLNAIGGYVQLLTMGINGPVTPEQIESLDRIDRSQRHLLRLINDVLNLSRIEAGRVDYAVDNVSLLEVVKNILPMVEPQLAKKKLQLESGATAEVIARADREKVQQILLNLLTNAVKFTPSGGKVRVDIGASSSGRACLSVSDTGIGIPAEMIERIFEPFIQVDSSRHSGVEGTGLGLAISRDLARGMGGDLTASSEPGVGTSFQLDLPAI